MIIIVMGVTGCGKSTVGALLAQRLGGRFFDADDHHPPANRAKLLANIPLTDEDRWPWLASLSDLLRRESAHGGTIVLACSALKASYREVFRSCGKPTRFVYLAGTQARFAERLRARAGSHDLIRDFDRILDGQFRDLEPPAEAIVVDTAKPADEQVGQVLEEIRKSCAR